MSAFAKNKKRGPWLVGLWAMNSSSLDHLPWHSEHCSKPNSFVSSIGSKECLLDKSLNRPTKTKFESSQMKSSQPTEGVPTR
ncbi:hypothetical protein CR513_01542, partial [Mucuna pruriens]